MTPTTETFIIDSDSHDHIKGVLNVACENVRNFPVDGTKENSTLREKVKHALMSELNVSKLRDLRMIFDKNNNEFGVKAQYEQDGELECFEGHLMPVMAY